MNSICMVCIHWPLLSCLSHSEKKNRNELNAKTLHRINNAQTDRARARGRERKTANEAHNNKTSSTRFRFSKEKHTIWSNTCVWNGLAGKNEWDCGKRYSRFRSTFRQWFFCFLLSCIEIVLSSICVQSIHFLQLHLEFSVIFPFLFWVDCDSVEIFSFNFIVE